MANGGIWVGIDDFGNLRDFGCNNKNEIRKEHNGIIFKSEKVPNFEQIVDLAIEAHRHIATCGFVGWDIALDNNNSPIFIEANLWWPGISYGEVCNGPIFGDRTDEVIEYVRDHMLKILSFTPKV